MNEFACAGPDPIRPSSGPPSTLKITPPHLQLTPHRYGDADGSSESEADAAEDSYGDEAGGDMLTPLADTGHEQGGLHTATRVFLSRFGASWNGPITVNVVSQELDLPATDAHCLLAVLEVLKIIIPRGAGYTWRGTAHVPMLIASPEFKVGATMQHGIAVSKLCATLIPHLVANERVPMTAEDVAHLVWQSQEEYEAGMREAEQQQLRALAMCTTDILVILAGLGYIELCPRPGKHLAFIFSPASSPDIISPKGMLQSKRMRNMRVLFDGPLPTALDAAVVPKPSARAPRAIGPTPPHASPPQRACALPESNDVIDDPSEGMWREGFPPDHQFGAAMIAAGRQENMHPRNGGAGVWGDGDLRLVSIQENGAPRSLQPDRGAAGKKQYFTVEGCDAPGIGRRKFAGVQSLASMFETTRLSQVGPHCVSKVKSLVREIEGPTTYRRV